MTCHTSTVPGKRVKLVFKDGTSVTSKFVERTGKFVVLRSGRYRGEDIRTMIVNPRNEKAPG